MANKRGAVLIIVMIFIITAFISSLALYSSVYNLAKMQGTGEVGRIREYYLASAGKTYAWMLLKDPVNYAKFPSQTDPPSNGDEADAIIKSSDALGINLGLTGSGKITITMKYNASTNKYTVTSTYSDH